MVYFSWVKVSNLQAFDGLLVNKKPPEGGFDVSWRPRGESTRDQDTQSFICPLVNLALPYIKSFLPTKFRGLFFVDELNHS
jgi:hypothetical protein